MLLTLSILVCLMTATRSSLSESGESIDQDHQHHLQQPLSLTTTARDFAIPDDWVSYGGKQFLFVMDAARGRDLNRDDASAACRSVDAQLVTIDTEDEFEFLKREIRQRVIGAGQEFAHERWWTAGRSFDKRWVWDRGQYTIPVTVSALKRKNVPQDGVDYYLALSHGYDQQGWRLRPFPANYALRYICQRVRNSGAYSSDVTTGTGSGSSATHRLYNFLSRSRDQSIRDVEPIAVTLRLSSIRVSSLEWTDHRLQWNSTMFGGTTSVFIAANRIWNPRILLPNSLNKHQLTEMYNARALVTMAGLVRVSFVEELSTGCETRPGLFPFDRMSCAIQMALVSTGARQSASIGTSSGLLLTSGSQPQLYIQGMTSWATCSQSVKRKQHCVTTAGIDDLLLTQEMHFQDENMTSAASTSSTYFSDCIRFDVCFRRALLYYAVVLLSPTIAITILVLVFLMTSPPTSLKLPVALVATTVCYLLVQFCCTLSETQTLPLVVVYPLGLIAISLTSACISLVLGRRDSFWPLPEMDLVCRMTGSTAMYLPATSTKIHNHGSSQAKASTRSWKSNASNHKGVDGGSAMHVTSVRKSSQQDALLEYRRTAADAVTGNCNNISGSGTSGCVRVADGQPHHHHCRGMEKLSANVTNSPTVHQLSQSADAIDLPPPPIIRGELPVRRRRCPVGHDSVSQFQCENDDGDIGGYCSGGELVYSDCTASARACRATSIKSVSGSSTLPSALISRAKHNSPGPHDPSSCRIATDEEATSYYWPKNGGGQLADSSMKRKSTSALTSTGPCSGSSIAEASLLASKRNELLLRRAHIERCVDMVLFVTTVLLFIGTVVTTIVVAF